MGLPDECRMKMHIKKESVVKGQEMIFEESQGNGAGRRFTRNDRIGREMIGSEIYLFINVFIFCKDR